MKKHYVWGVSPTYISKRPMEGLSDRFIKPRPVVRILTKCLDCKALVKSNEATRCKPCRADRIEALGKNRDIKKRKKAQKSL